MAEGLLTNVIEPYVGSDLDADASAGATSITPTDIDSFDWEGGTAMIGDPEGTNEPITYTVPLDADGEATGTLTLSSPLANSYTADAHTKVIVTVGGVLMTQRLAYFRPELSEEDSTATVPPSLWPLIPNGDRDEETSERIQAEYNEKGELEVKMIEAREPAIDGALITGPVTTTDGIPPTSSPTPTVRGALGALVAEIDAITNADPVTYEYHIDDATFTPTAGDPATLSQTTDSTLAWIRTMPDGSALDYTTTYHIKVIAKDLDGAAAPGAEGTGTPVQINSPDVAANAILANHILAGEVTAEKLAAVLTISSVIQTAESGQRVTVNTDGIILYAPDETPMVVLPTSPGQSALFVGDITVGPGSGLDVQGLASFRNDVTLETGTTTTLAASQSNPTQAPAVSLSLEQLPLTGGNADQASANGVAYTGSGGAGSATNVFITAQNLDDGSCKVEEYLASTGALNRTLLTIPVSAASEVKGVAVANVSGDYKFAVLLRVAGLFWVIRCYDLSSPQAFASREWEASVDSTRMPLQDGDVASAGLGTLNNAFALVTYNTSSRTAAQVARTVKFNAANGFAIGSPEVYSGKNYTPNPTKPDRFMGVEFDGTSRWISVRDDPTHGALNHRYNDSTLAYESNHDFSSSGFYQRGLAWDGTRFWSRGAGAPLLAKHTTWDWTSASGIYWVGFTYYDGTHESKVSPRQKIDLSIYRRGRIKITTQSFPSGVTSARTYVARNATAPATTALQRQDPTSFTDTISTPIRYMKDFDTATTNPPPTTSGFGAAGTPAVLTPTPASGTPWKLAGDNTFALPVLTTTQRDAFGSPPTGFMIFNSTLGIVEYYNGTGWRDVQKGSAAIHARDVGTSVTTGGGDKKATLDSVEYDIDSTGVGMADLAGDKIVVRIGGVYSITWDAVFEANSTGDRWSGIYVNTLADRYDSRRAIANASLTTETSVSIEEKLVVGDVIEFYYFQSSGATLNCTGDAYVHLISRS